MRGLDALHAGDHVEDDRKDAVGHAERNLGAGADAEIENKERQDRHLRDCVEQQHQRQRGAHCKTAEPDRQPDRDAGDDRQHKRDHELDERSLERGLHARIAEHARHRRNDGGWRTEEIGIKDGVTSELPEDKHQNHDAQSRNRRIAPQEGPRGGLGCRRAPCR